MIFLFGRDTDSESKQRRMKKKREAGKEGEMERAGHVCMHAPSEGREKWRGRDGSKTVPRESSLSWSLFLSPRLLASTHTLYFC